MAEIRRCEGPSCGQQFVAQRSSARFCSTRCRTAATRARQKNGDAAPAAAAVTALPVAPTRPRIEELTRAKLEKAAVLETPEAAVALDVARRLENATDSVAPALTREFSRLLEVALGLAESEGDLVDEIKARRDAKRASAETG